MSEKKDGAGGPKKGHSLIRGHLQAIVVNNVGDREVGVGWGL